MVHSGVIRAFGFRIRSSCPTLQNILFPNMSDRLGGAFHVTKPSALEGIILRGIVPGGNDSARRLAVHFGVFAPWDSKNITTKTVMHDVKGR